MSIRRKLLVLLLAIALVPLAVSSWLDVRALRALGDTLAEQSADEYARLVRAELEQVADDYARIIDAYKRNLETLVVAQANRASTLLAAGPQRGAPPVQLAEAFREGASVLGLETARGRYASRRADPDAPPIAVSFKHAVFNLDAVTDRAAVRSQVDALAPLGPYLAEIHQRHRDLVFWQYAAFETGLRVIFPGHAVSPSDYDPRQRPWYREQSEVQGLNWARPHIDAISGQVMLTVTHPIVDGAGGFAGVSAVDVAVERVMEELALPPELARGSEVLVVNETRAADGSPQWAIVARRDLGNAERAWDESVSLDMLEPSDLPDPAAFVAALSGSERGTARAAYDGVDSFWIHRRLDPATVLVLLVPVAGAVEPALAIADFAVATTRRHIDALIPVFGLVVLAVVGVALLVSRSVVTPLSDLHDAVREVARGDFDTRVRVTTNDEIGRLGLAFNRMVPRLAAFTRMSHSMALAREVQQKLLPTGAPHRPCLDIAGKSAYCDQTGGDYYDFLDLDHLRPGLTGIAVGDVAGHGISSALLMATVRALLRGIGHKDPSPAAVLDTINQHLVRDAHGGRFMTLFYMLIDAQTHTLHWASAGHDACQVFDPANGTFTALEGPDIPLGIEAEWKYAEAASRPLKPGEIAVLGTDGVWETRNEQGSFFGKDRLRRIVEAHHERSAVEICDEIFLELAAFRGNEPQRDDVTIIVVKVGTSEASAGNGHQGTLEFPDKVHAETSTVQ